MKFKFIVNVLSAPAVLIFVPPEIIKVSESKSIFNAPLESPENLNQMQLFDYQHMLKIVVLE